MLYKMSCYRRCSATIPGCKKNNRHHFNKEKKKIISSAIYKNLVKHEVVVEC